MFNDVFKMNKEQNLKNYIKVLAFGMILFAVIAFLNKYDLDRYKEDVYERQNNACWLWLVGSDGIGLGAKTYSYCKGFEETCRSDFDGFNCEWLSDGLNGCRCKVE